MQFNCSNSIIKPKLKLLSFTHILIRNFEIFNILNIFQFSSENSIFLKGLLTLLCIRFFKNLTLRLSNNILEEAVYLFYFSYFTLLYFLRP